MAIFLAISSMLCLAVLGALLRPLWGSARSLAMGVALVVLVSTVLLYRIVGTPQALDATALRAPQSLDAAIVQLQAELKRNPDQPEGWRLLAQAFAREGKATQARDAYGNAARLAPGNADILAEAAQARALAIDHRTFDAQAVALLQRALQADARHQRARWFLGIAQRQAGNNAAAATTWEPLLAQVDAATASSLRKEIDSARVAAGQSALPASPGAGLLTVRVALNPEFAARVRLRSDAVVFVIARQPGGPPMPVAVERRSVTDLPFTATLDDADAPMPTLRLSQLREVELVARLSSSGTANRQEGDIESKPMRVILPAQAPVELLIGE